MIDVNKLKKVKESTNLYHIYIEGDYIYMIRYGDYSIEIEKTKRLHEKGVNFAGPINQIKFSDKQVVVEEYLAKGTTFEKIKNEYRFSSSLDSNQILVNYTMFFDKYLDEIKSRADADQAVYDKLFNDITEMNKEDLTVDTCSLGNLFFDKNIGFSIIDAYPGTTLPNIKELFWLVIGNVPSMVCLENNQLITDCVPKERYNEFITYINMITNKYIKAAQKINVNFNFNDLQINSNIVTEDTIDKVIKMDKDKRIHIGL